MGLSLADIYPATQSANNTLPEMTISGESNRGSTKYVGAAGEMVMSGHNDLIFDSRLQDFRSIVSRPFVVAEGVLAVGTVGSVVATSKTVYDLFNIVSPYRALFNWAGGVRFTTHLRLVVANTPQIQGAIALAHLPTGAGTAYPRLEYTTTVMQLPHAFLNMNVDTEATLCIPWDSPFDYMPLDEGRTFSATTKEGMGGRILANIVMPVRVADSSVPSYTLYCSFHDIEIIGEKPVLTVYAQSGDVVEDERPNGAVSKPLYIGSRVMSVVADAFSPYIPVVGKVLKIGSWATRFASRSFAAFGYSKPQVISAPSRMIPLQTGFAHLVDVEDYSINFGTMVDNRVVPDPKVSDYQDQMSFEFVLTRPAPLCRTSILSTSAVGSTLCFVNTCPLDMIWNGTTKMGGLRALGSSTTTAAVGTTPLSYLGQAFTYWRGGFTFTVTAAKTPFHSGKVVLGWVPVSNTLASTANDKYFGPAAASFPYLSLVWDFKAQSEVEFSVPFISPMPYLDVAHATGTFFIRVVEKLAFPPNVSPQIDLLVKVRANPGFELSCPRDPRSYFPVAYTDLSAHVVAQSGDVCDMPGDLNPNQPSPELSNMERVDLSVAEFCMGERLASTKQLAMRASLDLWLSAVGPFVSGLAISDTVDPYTRVNAINYSWATGVTGGLQMFSTNLTNRGLEYLGAMYAYMAGGVCYDIVPNQRYPHVQVSAQQVCGDLTVYDGVATIPHTTRYDYKFNGAIATEEAKALHVKMPFYSPLRRVVMSLGDLTMNAYALDMGFARSPYLNVEVISQLTSALTEVVNFAFVYKRAADDFTYSRFLGAPICAIGVSLSTPLVPDGTPSINPAFLEQNGGTALSGAVAAFAPAIQPFEVAIEQKPVMEEISPLQSHTFP